MLCSFWHIARANTAQAATNQPSFLLLMAMMTSKTTSKRKNEWIESVCPQIRGIDENAWIVQIGSRSHQHPQSGCGPGQKNQDREAGEEIVSDGQELETDAPPNVCYRRVAPLQSIEPSFKDLADGCLLIAEQGG